MVKISKILEGNDTRIQVRFSEEVEDEKNRFDFCFIGSIVFP